MLSSSKSVIFCTKQSHPWVWVSVLNRNFKSWALLYRYFQSSNSFSLHTNSRPRNFFGILTVALRDTRADTHDFYVTLLLFTLRASSYCHLVSSTRVPAWKIIGEENKKVQILNLATDWRLVVSFMFWS